MSSSPRDDGGERDEAVDTDEARTADEARAAALPEDSPLQPGAAAHVVDPATGEAHTGQ